MIGNNFILAFNKGYMLNYLVYLNLAKIRKIYRINLYLMRILNKSTSDTFVCKLIFKRVLILFNTLYIVLRIVLIILRINY